MCVHKTLPKSICPLISGWQVSSSFSFSVFHSFYTENYVVSILLFVGHLRNVSLFDLFVLLYYCYYGCDLYLGRGGDMRIICPLGACLEGLCKNMVVCKFCNLWFFPSLTRSTTPHVKYRYMPSPIWPHLSSWARIDNFLSLAADPCLVRNTVLGWPLQWWIKHIFMWS